MSSQKVCSLDLTLVNTAIQKLYHNIKFKTSKKKIENNSVKEHLNFSIRNAPADIFKEVFRK